MLPGPVYITPDELFRRAPLGQIQRAEIPGPQLCGTISNVTHSGASTGTVLFSGFPIDVYGITMTCVRAGDLGTAQFKFATMVSEFDSSVITRTTNALDSLPNAMDQQGTLNTWQSEINITGVIVKLLDGVGTPNSFLLNDTWAVTTTASELALEVCSEISAWLRKYLQNTGIKIDNLDPADRRQGCEAGRVILCSGRGEVPKIWLDRYEDAKKHLLAEAVGDLKLNSDPDPDDFGFPDYEQDRGAFRFTYPGTRIPIYAR